ncbi:NAD(P)-binding protein, partial [Periconia macrospinosa]
GPPPNLNRLSLMRWAAKNPPIDPHLTFAGKTILVTGANAGLGYEAAVKYAQKSVSRLILAVRSLPKGEAAKKSIITRSGRTDDFITILTVDLTSFASVQSFVTILEKETKELHIALLNAGIAAPSFEKLDTGYEKAVQVNVLSTALMAVLLLPLLRRTAESTGSDSHLTFVNSNGHIWVDKSSYIKTHNGSLLQHLNDPKTFALEHSYCGVKLLGMSVLKRVAKAEERRTPSRVIVNACCPGLCKTELGREFAKPLQWVNNAMQYFTARTAEQGARTLVGATALGRESMGAFWHYDVLHPVNDIVNDEKEMAKMWEDIAGVVRKVQPDLD